MKLKEIRMIDKCSLRQICIDNDFYTCGDNEEYDALLDMPYKKNREFRNLTNEWILKIALDIAEHSDMDELEGKFNMDYTAVLEHICFCIIQGCTTSVMIM